jgi:hypothetical protein
VIDAFSRKMYTAPIKNKTGAILVSAMKKIFKQMGNTPRYAQSDAGKFIILKNKLHLC